MNKKLSILIPAFNEAATIVQVLEKVIGTTVDAIEKEIIIIDDGSTDDTVTLVSKFSEGNPGSDISIIKQPKNLGKGAALQAGFQKASGDIILIQDADLEYDPADYNAILKPILDEKADVVYGSRFMGPQPHRVLYYWHYRGNKFITNFSNFFTDLNLSDMETGYKVFRAEVIKKIKLREKRFGIEPEITAKIAKIKGICIYEVGISYYGRTYAEGKKITWKDGVRALYCILKYNLFS